MTVDQDAYYVESPLLRSFMTEVRRIVDPEPDRDETVKLLRPGFAGLLADQTWLPAEFRRPDSGGGMGGGIGNYLSSRSAPPTATSPAERTIPKRSLRHGRIDSR